MYPFSELMNGNYFEFHKLDRRNHGDQLYRKLGQNSYVYVSKMGEPYDGESVQIIIDIHVAKVIQVELTEDGHRVYELGFPLD